MENINFKKVSFTYNTADVPAIKNITFSVDSGKFCLIIGKSGAGKSTLLKLMKQEITPGGKVDGKVKISGRVGYVSQKTEESIVTDKVRSELSFGLTNMGMDAKSIDLRVAEIASYFNLTQKLDRDISTLSGGEKQILNLASVMVMDPDVLVLDEPTCHLDTKSAEMFIFQLKKLHRDFGKTIIISEHSLEDLFMYSDSIVLLEDGEILKKASPKRMLSYLSQTQNPIRYSLPLSVRLYDDVYKIQDCKKVLSLAEPKSLSLGKLPEESVLTLKNISFGYEKKEDVLKNLSLNVYKNKINVILGANSSGKTTLLKVASGVYKKRHGKIISYAKTAMLCQNPFDLFTKETCSEEAEFGELTHFLEIGEIKNNHPYDISFGQAQRLALAKVIQTGADVILMDEPTKALDSAFKKKLGEKLRELCTQGKTILIASHDIDFVGEYADCVSFLSYGEIITTRPYREFFSSLSFYTTSVSRLCKGICDGVVSEKDLKEATGE